ncbi:uncharacterized protein LOC117782772 [Drosophila innubila]|uniref:uncharacterized protein LOC117782772 n=1 Tax=Drosophila innubila TaxID=198719 RepID=UPI00148CA7E9|nr:uncharacterized protein LOC117782772 [Drosophila innubila]
MAKMLRSLGAELKCHLTKKLQPVCWPKAMFHSSSLMAKKQDAGDPLDCPETKTTECKTLNPRKCSPTDPPVRSCSEQDCPEEPRQPCCVNTRLSKDACQKTSKEDKSKAEKYKWESMWESPKNKSDSKALMWDYPHECCPKCDDVRFDVLYYRPSSKYRQFQRTWWECCPRMVPKRVCSYCDAIPPEVTRRCLPLCPRSACNQGHEKQRVDCLNAKAKDCMRVTMPCCRAARVPPRCHRVHRPTNCVKPKCPYPSYSECLQMDPAVIPDRPPECRCLNILTKCDSVRVRAKMTTDQLRLCPCPKC